MSFPVKEEYTSSNLVQIAKKISELFLYTPSFDDERMKVKMHKQLEYNQGNLGAFYLKEINMKNIPDGGYTPNKMIIFLGKNEKNYKDVVINPKKYTKKKLS